MATIKRSVATQDGFKLPTDRRKPVTNPWSLAYLLTGEKKVGKTSFAIEGCEELVLQFDKPQLSYDIRELMPKDWPEAMNAIKALEEKAAGSSFPYERIVVDGVGEWYQMAQVRACKIEGVEHPSDAAYGKCWHKIRDMFLDAVNRLLRIQNKHECGLIFIAHSEWKERNKQEVLVPNLPAKCEEIINGKVDGWFNYGYEGSARVLTVRGGETIAAGHRIDGHFLTTDDRRVDQIHMGGSAKEAMKSFLAAYRNEQTYVDYAEWRKNRDRAAAPVVSRKAVTVKRR